MKIKEMQRVAALILVLALTAAAFPIFQLSAGAEAAWPYLSESSYCEYVSPGKTGVFLDDALSTPGSSGKAYNAKITAGDLLKIYEITGSYTYLAYPTSSGYRVGYVSTSTIFGVSAPKEQVTSSAKVTTYKKASSSNQSGYVAAGDTVYRLGSAGNGYCLVMYTAASGSRAYKVAFIRESEYGSIAGASSAPVSSASSRSGGSSKFDVVMELRRIVRGKRTLNGSTELRPDHTFVGTRANEQCKGYAKNLFLMCFGINVGSTKDNNYELNSVDGVSLVGTVNPTSEQNVRDLFANVRPGDFVQMRRNSGKPHSMIVYYTIEGGIEVLEANTDSRNTIHTASYTWEQLADYNSAISLYTATNYTLA